MGEALEQAFSLSSNRPAGYTLSMDAATTSKPQAGVSLSFSWPRAWELGLAFVLGICTVVLGQSAWKLIQPPVPLAASTNGVDINAADEGQLKQLPGVGPHLAARIVDHRDKHGPFQRVDDLRSVHGIGPATLERLRPVVMVSDQQDAPPAAPPASVQAARSGPKTLPAQPIDLNSATKEQLMMLPGIGPAIAERIVEDRNENGAFESVNQLTRIRGIKSKTVEKLLPYLTVKKDGKGA